MWSRNCHLWSVAVSHLLNNKFNFRNHRKIIVIDGSVGFMGGLNIGDEYLGHDPNFGFWRDTHLLVKGEAVRTLQLIFLQDWYYSTDHSFLSDEYLDLPADHEGHGGVQLIAGGPDSEWTIIKSIFFKMITSAEKSVWIASPYFVPDDDIFQALKVAALSGLDVRLLVPKNPDKRIVFHASRTYFPELLTWSPYINIMKDSCIVKLSSLIIKWLQLGQPIWI